MPRMRKPRVQASILAGFPAFASRIGLDLNQLLERSGLREEDLGDQDKELPLNAVAMLLTLASEEASDPCLGLHLAEAYTSKATSIIGYLLLNASSVRNAVKAVARYLSLVMAPVDARYEEDEAGGHLSVRFPPEFDAPRIQFISFAMAVLVSRLRKHAGPQWSPIGIDLEHRELPCRETVLRLLGPNVRYDKAVNTLHIRDFVLQRGSDDVDRHLFELIRQLGERLLSENRSGADFVQETRRAILKLLESGAVRVRDVAGEMGLSAGTLQSRLFAAGTTFEDVLLSTRRGLADLYLRDTELPLTEIALMLGFSELSAFTRAHQRWHGVPPSQRRTVLRSPV